MDIDMRMTDCCGIAGSNNSVLYYSLMDVTVFVMDGVADFGFAALLEALGMANALRDELREPPEPWHVRVAGLEDSVRSGYGHTVPTTRLDQLIGDPGLVVVPAVNVLGAEALIDLVSAPANHPLLERIRQARASGGHLAAACTGTFFLAEAGVLDGARATTSWWLGPSFRKRYPRVGLDESLTLCRSDHVTTAGASLSHLDLALALVRERSPALAELVGRYMAVGDRSTQANFSIPEVVARGNSLTAAFERWVRDHLDQQFGISQAAHRLGVTERSLQRATQAEIGKSPKDFVDDIRLERATRLLWTTELTVDAVATKVGYLNAGTLRNLVRRRRGMSLAELRAARRPW
ncbi:GlxA family transcriptional regulator [Nocardia wallacei]|uniref:GlxA family transcriptional regulator n=2 Tax=Nocardia wallacei TaxID=480035 RepID=UPI002454B8BC|nr:helix-turn-helix domain-containing protein [Nocardia wallacei]